MPAPSTPATSARASGVPVWVVALGTTLGMQTVASFLDQSLPIIAPLLTAGLAAAGQLAEMATIQVLVLARRTWTAR